MPQKINSTYCFSRGLKSDSQHPQPPVILATGKPTPLASESTYTSVHISLYKHIDIIKNGKMDPKHKLKLEVSLNVKTAAQ